MAEALQPTESDENAHPAAVEPLWSESWYADFVDPVQGLGGWLRLGLMPNEDTSWIHALVCGPDMPTIAIANPVAAVPATAWKLTSEGVEFVHDVPVPLRTYHVALRARAEAFDDPSALLRGERGRGVDLELDLTWTTTGTPYRYRLTTRYEIPCLVSGTIVADGHTYEVNAVAGQRDHSWGARDWWNMDWVWSALHLDGGDHLHAVDIRIPGIEIPGLGYHQSPGRPLVELESVTARETFGDNGLPTDAKLVLEPGGLSARIAVRGQAPVRLVSPDGRVSHFARAWVEVTTDDGRGGVGWIEWNHHRTATA